ncbi:MAG: hypothetical protein IPP49_20955 [Saprospiraceae bacterium]|nr:hypothetical protein [Saprospiraceae bacterium]
MDSVLWYLLRLTFPTMAHRSMKSPNVTVCEDGSVRAWKSADTTCPICTILPGEPWKSHTMEDHE